MESENNQEEIQINEFDNLIDLAMTQKPGEFSDQFVSLMRDRIAGKVDAIKTDMKQFLFAKPEQREVPTASEIDIVASSIPDVEFSKDEVEEEALGKEEMPDHGDVADEIEAATKEKAQSKPTSRWWTARQAQLAKEYGIKEDETQIDEKWSTDYEAPKSKRGMWDGYSLADLHKAKKTATGTRAKEINFAIRAKTGWGKA